MSALSGQQVPLSTQLLMRILERPGLVAAVRELPGAVLGKLIERIGLEDAGELVALASTAQLERVFDDDLWQAERVGGDETFRPERFALWLRVMLEAGEDALVRRLCELPQELVALAVQRLVLVVDLDVLEEQLSPGDEEAQALEHALDNAAFEEWEEFRVIARDPDAWDDVWNALMSLDRDHHERLRGILEQCCDMTLEYISGQGGLFHVLTADEMLESDVAAAREDRRSAEGFISAADARAFLSLARRQVREGEGEGQGDDERDPITRAYFRGLAPPVQTSAINEPVAPADSHDLAALLEQAEIIATPSQTLSALPAMQDETPVRSHLVAPLFEQAMKDLRDREPARFDERVREIGYLVNVWMAGGTHEGRRPRPAEAMEMVLKACEAGIRVGHAPTPVTHEDALVVLSATPADVLFRRGLRAG